ncbi:ion transporter [Flaviaesturariibacter aridisoli]|uniref:Ion transporter n=1 Tax=Flaviaesturariibacter aridisoli TaxID=2545761 RepID=A0A4R4DRL9_9BACT|nr:ion transporter [Flaviaesturariibacter aridisoli]TCZ65037.1 ion transporter [Flaviaesturariibacter aridisoli]
MYAVVKRRVYTLLDPVEIDSPWEKWFDGIVVALIFANTLAVILETVESLSRQYRAFFSGFELFSVLFFTFEYLLRLWSITHHPKYRHPITGRLHWMLSFGALLDLCAILPFYLPLLFAFDLRFIRMLRLARLLRFFKLGRYIRAARVIRTVFSEKKEELTLSLLITFCLIVVASCVMYFVEHDAQPDKFSSRPETMWWSVATLTTVGYGDMYPVTALGKTITAVISILGIGNLCVT